MDCVDIPKCVFHRYLAQYLPHNGGIIFLFPSSHIRYDESKRRVGGNYSDILWHVGPFDN